MKLYFEINENKHVAYQITGCSKSSAKGKFTSKKANTKNEERSQIDNLTLYLEKLEK